MAFLLLFFVSHLFTFLKPQQVTLPASLSPCQGFIITNSVATIGFTYSIDGGGDLNDDGFPDFAVADYPSPAASTIYIIYGNPAGYPTDIDVASLTSSQGFKITGATLFGYDNTNLITIARDVDGDGIADVVIGAGATSSYQGAAYVIYGKTGGYSSSIDATSLTSNVGFKITGGGGNLGWNVNTKVDLNGDTINDIIVTAKGVSTDYGAAYVVFGQNTRGGDVDVTTMLPTRGFTISGFSGALVGPIGFAGDFNADGIDDLIVTAPGALSSAGIVYVIYGQKTGFADFALSPSGISQGFMFSGVSPIENLATLPASAGDFNGDGISDIALGTFGASSSTGYAFILYGKKGGQPDFSTASMLPSQGFKITGVNANDCFGSSFASVPDINGDGISDLLIGARGYDSIKGAIYGIYGRKDNPSTIDLSNLTPDQGFTIFGNTINSYFAGAMSSISDINQDGMPDIIISSAQKAYVFFAPNAWLCDTCGATSRICQTCLTAYNYTADGHCYSKCPISYPYELDYECFTEDPSEFKEEDLNVELKNAIKGSGTATSVVNKIRNLWKPSRAVSFMYGQIRTTIIYMRYLNISRTLKLERVYQLYDDSDMEFIPSLTMPDSIKDAFPNEPLPYMLEKYELPSSFIANFGDDLMGIVIVFVLIVTVKLISFLAKNRIRKFPTLKKILHRVLITLQNNLIGSFIESTGPIMFFATMDYRTSSTDKGYYVTSPLICTFCIILVLATMGLNIWVLKKFEIARKASKKSVHPEKAKHKAFEELEEKYESIGVLFEEFDDSSFFKQSACFFYCLWALTQSLVIGIFFEYPLVQSIILVVLTWMLLLYLLIKRPFKSKLDIAQQLILIPALFTINICLMTMAAADPTHDDFQSTKLHTSNTILWILFIFQFVPLFFFAIELIEEICDFCKWLSTIRNKSKNAKIHPQPAQPRLQSPSSSSLLTQTRMGFNHSRTQLVDKVNLLSPISSQTSILKMDVEKHPVLSPPPSSEQTKLLSTGKFSGSSEVFLSPQRRRIPKPSEKRKSNLHINPDELE